MYKAMCSIFANVLSTTYSLMLNEIPTKKDYLEI